MEQPPKPFQTIIIESKLLNLPYYNQIIDIGNQLAQILYHAHDLSSILGNSQSIRISQLKDVTIKVIMPKLPPAPKVDKICRIKNDGKKKSKGKISSICYCSKCNLINWRSEEEQIIGDKKTILVYNNVKNMIRHATKNGIKIIN